MKNQSLSYNQLCHLLKTSLEPPTTCTKSLRHVGKTLQQMIDEGVGSSCQNPINIDQLDDGPGSSCHNPIVVDHPHTDNTIAKLSIQFQLFFPRHSQTSEKYKFKVLPEGSIYKEEQSDQNDCFILQVI